MRERPLICGDCKLPAVDGKRIVPRLLVKLLGLTKDLRLCTSRPVGSRLGIVFAATGEVGTAAKLAFVYNALCAGNR